MREQKPRGRRGPVVGSDRSHRSNDRELLTRQEDVGPNGATQRGHHPCGRPAGVLGFPGPPESLHGPAARWSPTQGLMGTRAPLLTPREHRDVSSQSCATQPCSPATRFLAPTTACSCGPFEYPHGRRPRGDGGLWQNSCPTSIVHGCLGPCGHLQSFPSPRRTSEAAQ